MFLFAICTLPSYIGLCPPKLNSEIGIHPSEISPDKEIIVILQFCIAAINLATNFSQKYQELSNTGASWSNYRLRLINF